MIFERTLSNGFELIVQPTNAPVAAVQVWVDVGSIDEGPLEAGFCHFIEHMLFKGSRHRTTAEIAGAIEGAGGEMNAFTSFEYTVFHITLSNQKWELANDILADMVLGSTFLPREFNPEKEVILEEIKRGEDSPERQLYRGAYKLLYGNVGYGRPVIGYPTTVRNATASRLKGFWRKWYAPNLMTLVVAGDVDPAAVELRARKIWGAVRARAPRLRRRDSGFDQRVAFPKSRFSARPFPVNAVRWVGVLPGCSLREEIVPALDVASMVLGQGESSRLYRRLFREEQSVTSIGAGLWAPAGTGMFSFDGEAPLEKSGLFRKGLVDEVRRFCENGPTREELERAKVTIETERVYASQSMDGLANRLGFLKTTLGNPRFDLEYMAGARELTPEDVRDAARQYLDLGGLREFALLPKGANINEFWKSENGSVSVPKRKTVRSSVVDRAQISLPNGIELVLYPRQDAPVIAMQACSLAGLRAETRETAGIGNVLAEVWEKGPRGWTADKFAEFLEGRGARIEAFSGRNSVGLSSSMLTAYLDEIGPLFAETLFNPALEADEFNRAKTLALEDIRTQDDDLGRVTGRLFTELLFEGHPYAQPILGYADSVSKLTCEQLKAHFGQGVQNSQIIVAVSGKFNPDRIVGIFEKIERSRIVTKSVTPLSFEAPRAPRIIEVKKNREQSHVIVGYLGTRVNDPARYDLRVLLTVLGGQSGRLFTELRDKKGLCYTVAPISFEGIEPGYVGAYMGFDPSKRTEVIEGIRRELERLVEKPVTAAELKRAKEFVLGRHHMDMQHNSSVAGSGSFNTLYGLGFDEHTKLGERLRLVNAASIQKLAMKLFSAPSVTALVI